MAETKGYTCDRPQCGRFAASMNGLPEGWVRLMPSAHVPVATGEEQGRPSTRRPYDPTAQFDLCSNACVAILALERAKANGEATPGVYVRELTRKAK